MMIDRAKDIARPSHIGKKNHTRAFSIYNRRQLRAQYIIHIKSLNGRRCRWSNRALRRPPKWNDATRAHKKPATSRIYIVGNFPRVTPWPRAQLPHQVSTYIYTLDQTMRRRAIASLSASSSFIKLRLPRFWVLGGDDARYVCRAFYVDFYFYIHILKRRQRLLTLSRIYIVYLYNPIRAGCGGLNCFLYRDDFLGEAAVQKEGPNWLSSLVEGATTEVNALARQRQIQCLMTLKTNIP